MRAFARLLAALRVAASLSAQQTATRPLFNWQEVMIPMRDAVHLQTVILTPGNQRGPLPILLERTPYGVPGRAPAQMPPNLKELSRDGYI